jgi:hypothetical protein
MAPKDTEVDWVESLAKDSSPIHRLLLAWWRCTTLGGADQEDHYDTHDKM